MKLQYASFLIPLYPNSSEQDELNRFLRGHRIVQTRKEIVTLDNVSNWAILVEYLDTPQKFDSEQIKNKIDYKDVLNETDFAVFSKLREIRKKLAEDNGVPVFAICTNEQLAEIAKQKPKSKTEFLKIEGIGQSKADKYTPAFLECLASIASQTPLVNEENKDTLSF